jgi:hypothetical protein
VTAGPHAESIKTTTANRLKITLLFFIFFSYFPVDESKYIEICIKWFFSIVGTSLIKI